jgi:hypothetical protein
MQQDLVDQSLPDNGILADILYVGDDNPKIRQNKSRRNVVIPVNDYTSNFASRFHLDPGQYVIQATLPTGELVTKDVQLTDDSSEVEVKIRSELESPHEWLRWHNFLGNVQIRPPEPDALHAPESSVIAPSFDNYRRRRLRYRKMPDRSEILPKPAAPLPRGAGALPADIGLQLDDLHARILPSHHLSPSGHEIWHLLQEIISSKENPRTIQQNLGGDVIEPAGRDNDFALYRLAAEGPLALYDQPKYPVDYVGNDLERLYMTLSSTDSLRLITLPIPWPQLDQNGEAVSEIMVPARGSEGVIDSNLAITDRKVGSALGYLTAGDLTTASKLFGQAREMLYGKVTHPFGAVVGGYVMLKTSRAPGPWVNWVKNLMNWFDWLPDGAIQFAWLKIEYQQNDDDLQQAHDALLLAIDRGLPVCSLGIAKLMELLRLFAEDDPLCAEHLQLIQPVAWRTDMGAPFTMIDLIRG